MNRIVPNSYQKPNLYTDKLMRFLTGDEWKTLDYALRRTFGFQRETDRISVSQFMNGNGRLDGDGVPVEFGTGLSREAQRARRAQEGAKRRRSAAERKEKRGTWWR